MALPAARDGGAKIVAAPESIHPAHVLPRHLASPARRPFAGRALAPPRAPRLAPLPPRLRLARGRSPLPRPTAPLPPRAGLSRLRPPLRGEPPGGGVPRRPLPILLRVLRPAPRAERAGPRPRRRG